MHSNYAAAALREKYCFSGAQRQPTKGDNRKIDGRRSISNAERGEYIQITSNVLNGEL
jgi:hypothetical protein